MSQISHSKPKTQKERDENRTRSARTVIRLLPDEKHLFKQNCKIAGLTEADYFRRYCLKVKPIRFFRIPDKDREALLIASGQIGKLGNNINQMTRYMHRGGQITPGQLDPVIDRIIRLQDRIDYLLHPANDNE